MPCGCIAQLSCLRVQVKIRGGHKLTLGVAAEGRVHAREQLCGFAGMGALRGCSHLDHRGNECGRNTNNDHYLYINVDDNPDPFTELRRLLDLALAYNYGDHASKLLGQQKIPEARQSAQ